MGNDCSSNIKSLKSLSHTPDAIEVKYYENGKIFEARGEYQIAIASYQKIFQSNPKSAAAYYAIGKCYLKMGDFSNSLENLQQSLDLYPNNKYAYNAIGIIFDNIHDDQNSIMNFKKSIQIDPRFSYPYNGLGNLFFDRKRYVQAIKYYQRALELDPRNSLILLNLANCHMQVGNQKEAIINIQKSQSYFQLQTDLKGTNKIFYQDKLKKLEKQIAMRKSSSLKDEDRGQIFL